MLGLDDETSVLLNRRRSLRSMRLDCAVLPDTRVDLEGLLVRLDFHGQPSVGTAPVQLSGLDRVDTRVRWSVDDECIVDTDTSITALLSNGALVNLFRGGKVEWYAWRGEWVFDRLQGTSGHFETVNGDDPGGVGHPKSVVQDGRRHEGAEIPVDMGRQHDRCGLV